MKILFTLFLVFCTASVFGDTANVRPSWSGAWFNPGQSGHGITVEVLNDERTLVYWYTYDLEGNPLWLMGLGENSEVFLTGLFNPHIRIEATAYAYDGMIFGEFDPATANEREWGVIIVDFPYWACNQAHMEWIPTMDGYSPGSTDLVRLTSLYEMACVDSQDLTGAWEVQFGYDTEPTYPVEIIATPNPEFPETRDLLFEFFDGTGCLWSGEVLSGFGLVMAEWGNQCGTNAVEHSGGGRIYFEHKFCDSDNHCSRKDEVMIFEDAGAYLIFSR